MSFFNGSSEKNQAKRRILIISVSVIAVLLLLTAAFTRQRVFSRPPVKELSVFDPPYIEKSFLNEYDTFNILTCLRYLNGTWFLVDCYHDRILYSERLEASPKDWKVMTREIKHGHTIDSDGEVFLADDTENNRVLVFKEGGEGFELTGVFNDIGILPHYVVYDENSERFYVLSSMTGELYVFKNKNGEVIHERTESIKELNDCYVRSFTIMGDEVYFVSGNKNIIRARLKDLKVLERFPVGDEIAGMVQLEKLQDYYYITVSTDSSFNQDYATFIRTKDLKTLAQNDYEVMYNKFEEGGTPYFIGRSDSHFYLTEHRLPDHQLWQFDIKDNEIVNVMSLH